MKKSGGQKRGRAAAKRKKRPKTGLDPEWAFFLGGESQIAGLINLKVHFDAVTQVEKVAQKCLKPDDWLLDHIQEELAFMRGADLRR